jgi:hypothetical protein
MFEPLERVSDCRDLMDNKYLELALIAGAWAIVSSDDDLLVLDPLAQHSYPETGRLHPGAGKHRLKRAGQLPNGPRFLSTSPGARSAYLQRRVHPPN